MPRYYFHLYQGSQLITHDGTGYECPNDVSKKQRSFDSTGDTRRGILNTDFTIQVMSEGALDQP